MSTSRFAAALILSALSLALLASKGHAATVFFGDSSVSTEGTGVSYQGSLDYQPAGADAGLLTITLTNTTDPASIGGYLNGFVFNVNGAFDVGTATLASTTNSAFEDATRHVTPAHGKWPETVTYERADGSPYGSFEAGAALGGSFLGGGNPNLGIPVGGSATFVFNVVGAGVGSLSDLDFLSENGVHPPGSSDAFFVTRFRGLANGDSDKVPGIVIPLPASVWGGFGLLGLLGAARIRKALNA